MKKVKLQRKITNIVCRRLSLRDAWQFGMKIREIAAYIEGRCDTLYINPEGGSASEQAWWERNIVTVITHEDIHLIFYKLGLNTANEQFDNERIFKNTSRNHFLVDGNWDWLDYKWEWKCGQWIRKISF